MISNLYLNGDYRAIQIICQVVTAFAPGDRYQVMGAVVPNCGARQAKV
jgi:hypothetical protein